MSNHNHHYRDPELNPAYTVGYTLLVQVGADSLSYAITNSGRLLVLEENVGLDDLNEQSETHSLLFAHYHNCIVGLQQSGFTFIPASLYKTEHTADYARFLDVKDNEKVFSQPLDADNQVIYKVTDQVAAVAEKLGINNAVFATTGWIRSAAAENPANETLYINIGHERVELLNFNNGKLRFYNSFEFKTPDELVYFAMFVADELKLSPQNATLLLSGDVDEYDVNFGRLDNFFNKVELNQSRITDLPWDIASHNILTLTALTLCGSSEAH